MNNLLQNLQQNLQKIPQSAKVGAVALLFVAALTTWGLIAFRPPQEPQPVATTPAAPVATQPNPTASAQPGQAVTAQPGQEQPTPSPTTQTGQAANPVASRPLEVVPIPFLRNSTANATSGTPENATSNPAAQPSTTSVAKAPARPALPPNPFAPLISETPSPTTTASAVPGQQPSQPNFPTPTATGTSIQSQQPRVQVSQGLPRIPGLAGSRPTPTITQRQTPIAQNPNTVRVQPGGNVLPQTNRPNTARPGNNTTTTTTNSTSNNNTNNSTAQAQVRPGGSARLTPGGSANNAPGSISPAAGALPIRISPLERELARPNPTPALTPPSETPAANPTVQTPTQTVDPTPTTAAVVEVETPSVGVLDGSTPQSERNPDFSGVQVGGRTNAASPEIRNEIARPRPQQQTTTTTTTTTAVDTAPPNPIETYVRDQNLRLANVVLGATNVAIFQSKDGFVVLPVGATLPNSNILLRSLNAREALLVQGTNEVNLPVQNP